MALLSSKSEYEFWKKLNCIRKISNKILIWNTTPLLYIKAFRHCFKNFYLITKKHWSTTNFFSHSIFPLKRSTDIILFHCLWFKGHSRLTLKICYITLLELRVLFEGENTVVVISRYENVFVYFNVGISSLHFSFCNQSELRVDWM